MMCWSETRSGYCPITVTVPDQTTLLADLRTRLETGAGFSVATLNLDHVIKMRRDSAFETAYAGQTHVTADGNPIVWLSRLAGQTDITLVTGSDLVVPAATVAAETRASIALFGSTEASLQEAAAALQARIPDLQIALTLAPPMGFDPDGPEAADAIEAIAASGARLVFLALGAPKQERFAVRAAKQLPQTGFLSIGASLDFLSGTQTRAPRWVRVIAAEWLWRMMSDPKRLAARYGACLVALPGLARRALQARRSGAT